MRRYKAILLIIGIGIIACSVFAWYRLATSADHLLSLAKEAFTRESFEECRNLADRALNNAPQSNSALILAGQASMKLHDSKSALKYFSRVSPDGTQESIEAKVAAGELAFQMGLMREAEQNLRAALAKFPGHGLANGLLAYLLVFEGRSWEALPFLLAPVRARQYPLEHLFLLGSNEPLIENKDQLKRCQQAAPADLLPLLGQARADLLANRNREAESLLSRIVEADPSQIEAQARLGEALARSNSKAFPEWNARLPPDANQHPQIWVARGLWAEENDRAEVAARCFWEAVHRDPEHRLANHHLGMRLLELQKDSLAEPFLKRAKDLEHLGRVIGRIRSTHVDADRHQLLNEMSIAAELTERLGRMWEAWGWSDQALRLQATSGWARAANQRLSGELHENLPRTVESHRPRLVEDLASLPLPSWTTSAARSTARAEPGSAKDRIHFRNDATAAGLQFTYDNGGDLGDKDVRLIETTGGGVGVLDYDGDLWPDVYFTQGGTWPPIIGGERKRDRLFRNTGTGAMRDVTEPAFLGDPDYSQGVAVGDFDNDGFADLYVGNVGDNRLYRNNGDGTFSEVANQLAGSNRELWTTSCLVADVNGDTWPDLYDVNYVANRDLSRLICQRGNEIGGCGPSAFEAAQDRLCLGTGNGEFKDVSEAASILAPEGMGLGIVAGDFDGGGRISLFVANDAFPNFFFQNVALELGGMPRFEERGVISGLAFDRNGLSQACMGVAAGDANDDGLLDLFVTNFYNESNTLYLQRSANSFDDATQASGLREPSLPMLGFGSQFLDADLDGKLDLVLVNGHVFDMSDRDIPYRMRPQFFRNVGNGQFQEVMAEEAGEFFSQPELGRGLARLDWNRDGREEFAVSHLDTPAALVTNATETKSHYLIVHLRGRECSRDAIGAIVTVHLQDRALVRQLTAGDGYEASNQRVLVFGLGDAEGIRELTIQWPQGKTERFPSPPIDCELLWLEGRTEPVRLPKPR